MKLTNEHFNNGDIVRLKSGGSKMTVEGYKQTDNIAFLTKEPHKINRTKVTCRWFEGNVLKSNDFDNNELVLIEKN